jgi:preprotein translocase subunit YajC
MESIWVLALAYPVVIAALFYFAFLRPVLQDQKKHRQVLEHLRVGDEVVTQGGLIATVKEVRVPEERGPTELILDLGGLEVRAVAGAIVRRLTPEETEPAAEQNQTIEARGHS